MTKRKKKDLRYQGQADKINALFVAQSIIGHRVASVNERHHNEKGASGRT